MEIHPILVLGHKGNLWILVKTIKTEAHLKGISNLYMVLTHLTILKILIRNFSIIPNDI